MRSCVVCGSFYESNKDNLISQIKNCFSNNLGPGLPTENNKKDIVGIIVPHAGYFFSGACAAHAYKEIYNSKHIRIQEAKKHPTLQNTNTSNKSNKNNKKNKKTK